MSQKTPSNTPALNDAQILSRETLTNLCAAWEKVSPPEPEPTVDIVSEDYDKADVLAVCRHGDLPALIALIEQGVEIHDDNDAALQTAAKKGQLEIVRLLLANDADVHAEYDYALRWAASKGHTEVVRLLLAHDADIHDASDGALRWAAKEGRVEIVGLLLANNADVHAQDDYALRWAANYGEIETVRLLLAHDADIHAEDDQALQWAVEGGFRDMTRLLLQHGALIEKLTPEQRETYNKQNTAVKNELQVERKLTEIFNPAIWLERKPEMIALWNQVPEDLKNGFDFSHVVSQISIQSLKQNHRKRILLVK